MLRFAFAVVLGLAATASGAFAEDEPDAPEPPPLESLPPIEVVAPRIHGTGVAYGTTTLRRAERVFDTPAAVTVLDQDEILRRRAPRSLPDALKALPGVMVQKTAPHQSSPFIRGFTAYQNLMLIDGIRLNNSAFRAGPNQYWSTIDPYSIADLEVVRGPHSVLYGSDAVGGTVNVIPWRRTSFRRGLHVGGAVYSRYASAENAVAVRSQVEGNLDNIGWAAGVTYKHFGDITSGAGRQPETGDIDDWAMDARVDIRLSRPWELTFAYQRVRQFDAPRTERTVFSVPFAGTAVGSELERDFDQERDLAYARLSFDGGACCRPISRGHIAVSWHRQAEERDRERTGDRRDLSGFEVDQYGVQVQLESPTRFGRLTYGAEFYHDEVRTFRDDLVAGVPTLSHVQGPLGDDGTYDLLGVYLQDQMSFGFLDVFLGGRLTHAVASADRVDDPAVAGNDPATPGNIISVSNDWTDFVASLRAIYHINRRVNVFGGVSQAFRAPTLHDLTALDSTSVVETPAPGLSSEKYLSFEAGVKWDYPAISGYTALWYTVLDDAIIRSPTGASIMGVPEVRKDNIGDGYAWGFEAEVAWRFHCCWMAFANATWMDSEVDQLDTAGNLVKRPLSRNMPFASTLAVRYGRPTSRLWGQAEWLYSAKADKLSFRDETDSRRIPPGGTPSWSVFNVRAGYLLREGRFVTLGVENLFDENYRIHGSGQNEPGRQIVVAFGAEF